LRADRWRAGLVALALLSFAGPFMHGAANAAGTPLVVALDHVAPSPAPGAKVRTPATIDAALAGDLAKRLGRRLEATEQGPADLRLTKVDAGNAPPSMTLIPVPYRVVPMAIMRTDSDIRRWEHLRGRTACVAADGAHVGDVERRHGAVEIVHPTLTEALVSLRTGGCDVLVHDSALLEELLRLPEWKKFSRRLASRQEATLAILVPDRDESTAARVREVVGAWKAQSFTASLVKAAVRDIAWEVYVEQEVPDCH
jgi:polar amino acid transport system substrate-binding protein